MDSVPTHELYFYAQRGAQSKLGSQTRGNVCHTAYTQPKNLLTNVEYLTVFFIDEASYDPLNDSKRAE